MDNHFITFNKDEIIFLEGQSSDCAYIIESGKVGIYREDSLGNRFLVRELGNKELFGEMKSQDLAGLENFYNLMQILLEQKVYKQMLN